MAQKRGVPWDHIVIETTGVAEPREVRDNLKAIHLNQPEALRGAVLHTLVTVVDSSTFPQVYQRDEGTHLHMGVLLPGFASRETCTMAANVTSLTLTGEISNLEAPFAPIGPENSVAGPFGPFERSVTLTHPVDVAVPVESRMGLGILEFRFQKGLAPAKGVP